ncbi:MAG: DUF2281 domain-containing protein [Bacteroidales bacterium]
MELAGFIEDFENLPKHIQKQLIEYAEFLISKNRNDKRKNNKSSSLSFSWENGLSDLKNEYSSVELQHKINDLR